MKKDSFSSRLHHAMSTAATKSVRVFMISMVLLSISVQPVFAAPTIWEKANEIMQDVYNQILLISTIAAIVTASVALLMMNFSRSGRTVDESRASDFTREGYLYTLLDVLKSNQTDTEMRDHIEVITKEVDTKDFSQILPLFEPTLDLTTEDGYTGTLSLDHTSLTVEAAGYKSSTRTVTATRTYPNLSAADTSLIPKSIEENGRTLTLADVQWTNAAANTVDGYEVATRYTASATYTGTATSSYATGYIASANYSGELVKSTQDTVVYTAIFSGEKIGAEAEAQNGLPFSLKWFAIPPIIAIAAAGGYFGYKAYKKRKTDYM